MKIYVFYGLQFMPNEGVSGMKNVPDGAWIKMGKDWYKKDHGALVIERNHELIPDSVRAQLLLLEEGI